MTRVRLVDGHLEEGLGCLGGDGGDGLQAAGGEDGGRGEARPAGGGSHAVLTALEQKLDFSLLSSVGFH